MKIGRATISFANSLRSRLPDDAPIKGFSIVEGEIKAHFVNTPALQRLMRADRARWENVLLRRVRPMMPKRLFQRLRGRMRAARRSR